jgi:putative NIF3 family GTP cyclohydrolase 1 type 2
LDRKIRARRIREAKRLGVAIYSSHLPLDAHPEIGNAIGLLRALGLERAKRRPFGKAMGREIGWKVALLRSGHAKRVGSFEGLGGIRIADLGLRIADLRKREGGKVRRFALLRSGHAKRVGSFEGLGGIRIADLGLRIADLRKREGGKVRRFEGVKGAWPRRSAALQSGGVRVVPAGPGLCRKIGVVTGGFGDLDQVVKAGLDTLVTGEADYPTEVKARELGINLILAGHAETETFGAQALAKKLAGSLS